MLLLRRGRPAHGTRSSFDIDVTIDLGSPHGRSHQQSFAPWRPPIEVFETDGELVVRAEIGGLANGDVEVLVAGNELRIRGERSVSRPANHRLYHESRVRYGPFEAAVHLPFPVEVEAATADYVDGFLSVSLPRRAATRLVAGDEHAASGTQRGEQ